MLQKAKQPIADSLKRSRLYYINVVLYNDDGGELNHFISFSQNWGVTEIAYGRHKVSLFEKKEIEYFRNFVLFYFSKGKGKIKKRKFTIKIIRFNSKLSQINNVNFKDFKDSDIKKYKIIDNGAIYNCFTIECKIQMKNTIDTYIWKEIKNRNKKLRKITNMGCEYSDVNGS